MMDSICKPLQWWVLILIPALGWWHEFVFHCQLGVNFTTRKIGREVFFDNGLQRVSPTADKNGIAPTQFFCDKVIAISGNI